MRIIILNIAFLLIGFPSLEAQNLVVNGYFEEDSCRITWRPLEIQGWEKHNTADHIHYSCSFVSSITDYWIPYEGRGAVGFHTVGRVIEWSDTLFYREYVKGTFKQALIKGKIYQVSYWVKPSGFIDKIWNFMTSDQISLVFQRDTSQFSSYDTNGNYIDYYTFDPDITNPHGMLYDYENYIQIESCYTASGDEIGLMFGNFLEYGETNLDTLRKDRENAGNTDLSWFSPSSYVLLDNVEIFELTDFGIGDTTLCEGSRLIIDLDSSVYDEIYFDNKLVTDSLIINDAGDYTLSCYKGSCQKNINFNVDFNPCIDCNFYISNIISSLSSFPNNQTSIRSDCDFRIVTSKVYDRWGSMVYISADTFTWGGSKDNISVNPGVYAYDIEVEINSSESLSTERFIGTITVVR